MRLRRRKSRGGVEVLRVFFFFSGGGGVGFCWAQGFRVLGFWVSLHPKP